ncbi:uncharacterized protein [Solanum lycopersicum]|uniref:uncharacterized protein n=1 Tax=Solanum lycopersicum TaxID=4081 RepID=UPI0037495C6D
MLSGKKELLQDFHRLARSGGHLMSISDSGVTVQNGAKSSSVVEDKEKQESDPILLELKGTVNNQRVEVFSQWGDGVLRYQGATKMYRYLWEDYWWNDINRDIADFVSKCPNCKQVKVQHQKPGGMTQEIDIPALEWDVITMDFITGLPHTLIKLKKILHK